MKLSVILITKNEATNIRACLESVGFANEWIIVDSGSTDGTQDIARSMGATVIETDWPGFGIQKNRALDAATGDWILSIDADERVPAELREEILALLANPAHGAYFLPRLSSFCGRFIRHAGWYPDYIVRLFRKDAGRFSTDLVHESVNVQGATGKLKNHLLHFSYTDDDAYLRKLAQYSTLGAQQAFTAGKRASFPKALLKGFAAFLRSYVFKLGILDGSAGLMIAITTAESTYHKYFKLMLMTEAANGKHLDVPHPSNLLPPKQ